jgi:hypothetical protein
MSLPWHALILMIPLCGMALTTSTSGAVSETNENRVPSRTLPESYAPIHAGKAKVGGHRPKGEHRFGVAGEIEFRT